MLILETMGHAEQLLYSCLIANAQKSLFVGENGNGFFLDFYTRASEIGFHRAGSHLKIWPKVRQSFKVFRNNFGWRYS